MRLMDAELGESGRPTSTTSGVVPPVGAPPIGAPPVGAPPLGAPPLPLCDAAALDWTALVQTATRAMLQVLDYV